ncbi:MAG: tRNA (guanosine(37)-N1)-methyltransferase TrmD [Thiobacillaceae bacterium]
MRVDVVTLFPSLFDSVLDFGISARALDRGLFRFLAWNPRDFTTDVYKTVDDRPYGGGPGMVMLAEPMERALEMIKAAQGAEGLVPWVVYFTPRGQALNHAKVMALAARPALTLIAGRYEGVDERLIKRQVDEEISLGDFVLSGGEIPALALMDAIIRQLPGTLGNAASAKEESFVNGLLEAPCYTRPEVYRSEAVPAVLRSGDHKAIARWRLKQSLGLTWQRRPDVLAHRGLSLDEQQLLDEFRREKEGLT